MSRLAVCSARAVARIRPPLVPGVPLLGNLPAFARDVLGFCVRHYQSYGPVYRIRLLNQE